MELENLVEDDSTEEVSLTPEITFERVDPIKVLGSVDPENIEDVLILANLKDGQFFAASSSGNVEMLIHMVHNFSHAVLPPEEEAELPTDLVDVTEEVTQLLQ